MLHNLDFWLGASAYIYCTLTAAGACSGCVRQLTISPVFDWVNDICSGTSAFFKTSSPEIQFRSANRTAFVLFMVLFNAGYFAIVNLQKSSLFPKRVIEFLAIGVSVDSSCKSNVFVLPKKFKVERLLKLITDILSKTWMSVSQLESINCRQTCAEIYMYIPCSS